MEVIAQTVIPRHCVEMDEMGLSHMQRGLLHSNALITLVSAPTGSGKSFVFRKALLKGERILFIVPTKQLGKNLCESTIDDMMNPEVARREGFTPWSETKARKKIVNWNSDFTAALKDAGVSESSAQYYRKHMFQLSFEEGGEMLFATPELLSNLFLRPQRTGPSAGLLQEDVISHFDRIVFDEFHLIEERGFGFLAVLARIAKEHAKDPDNKVARFCLLSATPVDITGVLRNLDFDDDDIHVVSENIVSEGRALHGDVALEFVRCETPLDVIQGGHINLAQASQDNKIVIIYDALRSLIADEKSFHSLAADAGMDGEDVWISSSMNSAMETTFSGRNIAPETRSLIVATSTIEVGVTIPHVRTLIIDPGFTPLSFMQRIGRVARGDYAGRVVVCVNGKNEGAAWIRKIMREVENSNGQMPIQDLIKVASSSAQLKKRFSTTEAEEVLEIDDPTGGIESLFGQMGDRAVYASGLYWHAILNSLQESGLHRAKRRLIDIQPKSAKTVYAWMKKIKEHDSYAEEFVQTFLSEVHDLRGFSPTITVVMPDSKGEGIHRVSMSESLLRRHFTILRHFPVTYNAENEAQIQIDQPLSLYQKEPGDKTHRYVRRAILPNGAHCPITYSPVSEYLQALKALELGVTRRERELYQTAKALVATTGIVPYCDSEHNDVGSMSAII